ncbi:unnamed protein product [Pedinophyceae sp. YPF-701]|nr:unnamed protein product [Pedinophyceae sp. YPF-701]
MFDQGLATTTTHDQRELERRIEEIYTDLLHDQEAAAAAINLRRDAHATFCGNAIAKPLRAGFIALDASRTWIAYWNIHSLALLGRPLPPPPKSAGPERVAQGPTATREALISFLASCQSPRGGFGGGPGQLPHLATTYAAIAALVELGGDDALAVPDRGALWEMLLRHCVPPEEGGGMRVTEGGEVDIRGSYTAVASAYMVGLDVAELDRRAGIVDYVRRCQTHEGGLGGEPGNEAHGGYTYCGVACLKLLGRLDAIDTSAAARWASVQCQGSTEGGFRGRTDKLVDSCYAFWQAAALPILRDAGVGGCAAVNAAASGTGGAAEAWRAVADEVQSADLAPRSLKEQAVGLSEAAAAQEVETVQSNTAEVRTTDDEAIAAFLRAGQAQKAAELALDDVATASSAAPAVFREILGTQPASGAPQDAPATPERALFDALCLQGWVLACGQPDSGGGLRDKPGKSVDHYHTCYALSGLSVAQHCARAGLQGEAADAVLLGGPGNLLRATDPATNVVTDNLRAALRYYGERGGV